MKDCAIEFDCCISAPELSWLEPAIEGWRVAIEEACDRNVLKEDDEAPYATTERACVSLLAAGAWKANMIAVEEPSVIKADQSGLERYGRTDFYVSNKTGAYQANFEAKIEIFPPDGDLAVFVKGLEAGASDARMNRRRTNIGVCFFPLYVSQQWAGEAPGGMDAIIEKNIGCFQKLGADCLAWSFPTSMRKRAGPTGKRQIWPGLFLAMRLADSDPKA